jgi:hypothetical protein
MAANLPVHTLSSTFLKEAGGMQHSPLALKHHILSKMTLILLTLQTQPRPIYTEAHHNGVA